MIFRKSLSNKKGSAYSFISGISASFVPAVCITLFLTLFTTVLPAINFIDYNSAKTKTKALNEVYKFLVFGTDGLMDTATSFVILGILGIAGIIIAVRIFSFICDKKTVNVYYSLGIKRSHLFITKYLSGALLICASVAVSTILSYLVNLIFLGASWQLSLVLLHLYCGLSVFLLICYSSAAVVFSSVGTVSEAVVFSVALLFAPTIIIFMTERIIGAFLPSSTFNDYIAHFTDNPYYYSSSASLLEATSAYNPVLFFANDIITYSTATIEAEGIMLKAIDGSWVFPNLLVHVPWFIISIALGVLGALLFRRIKAENCGFLNTNKVLSNLTIFELCLCGAGLPLSEMRWYGATKVLIMGAGISFVFYLIAEIFLKRNVKKILTALYKYVAHIAVIALIFTVCATGAFGYSTYIPNRNKVVSAEIALPLSYSELTSLASDYGWDSTGVAKIYTSYRETYLPLMTDPSDIDAVMELNRKIIADEKDTGIKATVIIRYNYENGGFSERKHTLTNEEEISLLLSIRDTKAYKNRIYELFFEENRLEKIKEEGKNGKYVHDRRISELCFEYDYSDVSAITPSLQEERGLELTKEQFTALKNAVYQDIISLSSTEYYSPAKKQIGVLSFTVNEKAYQIEGLNGYSEYNYDTPIVEEGITYVQTITPDVTVPDKEIPEDESGFYEEAYEETSIYKYETSNLYNSLGGFMNGNAYSVIITEDFTNTLALLKSYGLENCFVSDLKIENISFIEYDSDKLFNYYFNSDINFIYDFFAEPVDINYFYEYETDKNFVPEGNYSENIITDKEKLTELQGIMKLHEYTFNSGYFCLIKYEGGKYNVMYLSENDAPEYVRTFAYSEDLER